MKHGGRMKSAASSKRKTLAFKKWQSEGTKEAHE